MNDWLNPKQTRPITRNPLSGIPPSMPQSTRSSHLASPCTGPHADQPLKPKHHTSTIQPCALVQTNTWSPGLNVWPRKR